MRKSREFDNVLDECLERLLVKGETVEQCLRSFPEHADELKPLLETALATKEVSAIQPRPEFRDRARYQFYSALRETERKRSLFFFSWGWQPRWAVAVTIVLVLLLAGGGTVAAAGESMPDEPLYPVKLATEQVRLILTPSTLGKAELYAKLADSRVLEIVRMAGESKPEQVERTARRLDTYLTKIADLASTQEVTGSATMAPGVEEAPTLEKAPLLTERARGGQEARIKVDRRAELRTRLTHYATNHPARLRAMLNTAPESAKPALRRAIATSEVGYEKALEALD